MSSIRMISFVLMGDVSKEIDVMELSIVSSWKMNRCVITKLHSPNLRLLRINRNDSLEDKDFRLSLD